MQIPLGSNDNYFQGNIKFTEFSCPLTQWNGINDMVPGTHDQMCI